MDLADLLTTVRGAHRVYLVRTQSLSPPPLRRRLACRVGGGKPFGRFCYLTYGDLPPVESHQAIGFLPQGGEAVRLRAHIPAIPERRSDQTAARLARKVGPLFGVSWSEAPGGHGSWVCDYARVTLSEIMRGAPTPARRPSDLPAHDRGVPDGLIANPIANVTAARFGPDTKAAFVLTGANTLLSPIADALVEAFAECPMEDPRVLLAVYAYMVMEVFRSEPGLILAAAQAVAAQRALTAMQAPMMVGSLAEFAAHEWGAPREIYDEQHSPDRLDFVARLASALCQRIAPSQRSLLWNDSGSGISAEARLRQLVVGATETIILDVSRSSIDLGLRLVEVSEGRQLDMVYGRAGRIFRFMLAIGPHVEGARSDSVTPNRDLRRLVVPFLDPPKVSGDTLSHRARLTMFGGLIDGVAAAYAVSDMEIRHAWGRARERYADAMARVAGADDSDVLLERVRALAELVDYPVPSADADPRSPTFVRERAANLSSALELLGHLEERAGVEAVSHGELARVAGDLLIAINAVRTAQAVVPVKELPDVSSLNDLLSAAWSRQLARFAEFFETDSENYIDRLHDFAGFMLGRGSDPEMVERGLHLYLAPGQGILHYRSEGIRPGRGFGRTRRALQVATRGLSRRARSVADDPQEALSDVEVARRLASEIEAHPDTAPLFNPQRMSRAGTIAAISLIDCYITSVELGYGDATDQAWCRDRAGQLLDVACGYVKELTSSIDHQTILDELAGRYAALTAHS